MTAQEKKELIKKKIANGDKRSWNEITADLELQLWTEQFKGHNYFNDKLKLKNKIV